MAKKSSSSSSTKTSSRKPRRRPSSVVVLVDRCGLKTIGQGLAKVDGVTVHYLDDLYGDQRLPDVVFLRDAGERGWIVLTANPRMWVTPEERTQILESGTKVFCLANPNHTLDTRGFIVGRWFPSIRGRAEKPGPCFWLLDPNHVTKRHA